MRRIPETTRAGFTLIELLVVIAIIALLVTIVVGAPDPAHDLAEFTICKTNLDSVGSALAMYAEDSDLNLPVGQMLSTLSDEISRCPQPELMAALTGEPEFMAPDGFYCPSETDEAMRLSPENIAAGDIGYFYFSCEKAPTNLFLAQFLWRSNGVARPRRLRMDMHPETWVMSDAWFAGEPTPHQKYKKGINYLMVNGSVNMVIEQPRSAFR